MNEKSNPPHHITSQANPTDVSLIDLWLVLARRKFLIFGAFLAVSFAGVLYATLKPDIFRYSATLQVGSRMLNGDVERIEEPGAVVAKINDELIPVFKRAAATEGQSMKFRVESSEGLVTISGSGPATSSDPYLKALEGIVGRIVENHKTREMELRSYLEMHLAEVDKSIQKLSARSESLELRLEELRELENEVMSADRSDSEKTLALLSLSGRIDGLQEQLVTVSAQERDAQSLKLAVQEKLNSFESTRIIAAPAQSIGQVGRSGKVIVAVALFVGLALGVFLAFFAEFMRHVRHAQQSPD